MAVVVVVVVVGAVAVVAAVVSLIINKPLNWVWGMHIIFMSFAPNGCDWSAFELFTLLSRASGTQAVAGVVDATTSDHNGIK